ncbi:LegC family aminotransferase [Prochlorococcus sp. MIT 1307]|uniref:LegC family aminotransferase n=1 Tax=Prochlorococcus sp. MIT 1307 TaxID=3096219 RepID=UPI002A7609C9|nr:LegC family aminotransferase [Prochlorococcus sp. MIT 1307]
MSRSSSTKEILDAIQKVVGPAKVDNPIFLHEPEFKDTAAWEYVKECIDSGWVSTAGKYVNQFEEELCKYTGADYAIAVTNGTVALRLALSIINVKPDEEVIIPPLTFVATANAVCHLNAIPHFVDIESNTFGLCPEALQGRLEKLAYKENGQVFNRDTGRRIAAILPVHLFGNPSKIIELKRIAFEWELPLVEDAAEALGSWSKESNKYIHCGLFGAVGILSFNGNKIITTGGGGALITNDKNLALKARHISTTAKIPHPWMYQHDQIGWNDRMPNINAALGVSQMQDFARRLERKNHLADSYYNQFSILKGIELLRARDDCISNKWLMTARFTANNQDHAKSQCLDLVQESNAIGIRLRPAWKLLTKLPMFLDNPKGPLPNAESEFSRLVNLPSSPQICK